MLGVCGVKNATGSGPPALSRVLSTYPQPLLLRLLSFYIQNKNDMLLASCMLSHQGVVVKPRLIVCFGI